MATSSSYLAVIKASYDYEPQSEDEIAIKEDQILFLLEKTDEDWWKVKVKEGDEESEGGLVPAAYVEELPHKSLVKVLYDYDASAPGELSIKEDEELYAYDKDDDWLLVQRGKDGGAGFVPANYVEDLQEEEEEGEEPSATDASAIVVPPSPPRPTAPYVDPAERVAQTPSRAQVDSVQTWAVSEVDKKGKKKKGTLGIGSGAIFFASESDKTPVQKWQTADVESHRIEKSKHVHIEVGGPSSTSLHYSAGSKDVAEAIIAKLNSSKRASSSSPTPRTPSPRTIRTPSPAPDSEPDDEPAPARESPKPKKNGVNVHFATSPPSIISPREPSEDGDTEIYHNANGKIDDGQEWVTVLYDFEADGVDELTVHEGDRLVVLERDSDEWWKVRDLEGNEGVVPASYVELDVVDQSGTGSRAATTATQDEVAEREREAAEQARREEKAREREKREAEARQLEERERKQRVEAERRAKAEAAEAERKRKEQKEEEEAKRRLHEEQEEAAKKRAARESRSVTSSGSRSKDSRTSTSSPSRETKARTSTDGRTRMPSPSRTRTWHDRTGQFKVDAEFLGFSNGKLRLHKINGVVIEVPAEKMSGEDMRYIDSLTGKKDKGRARDREQREQSARTPKSPLSDDDVPLAERRKSLHQESRASPKPVPPKKTIDWFEFFLNAGCDVDDCTRYAHSFDRDKMDESILPDITEQTMRTLGLREGDIIRVKKAIALRVASDNGGRPSALEEQMKRDEEMARRLQDEENGGRSTPKRQTTAPNLFSGPGGALKNNTRRGRPQPKGSTPPATVDLLSLSSASEQINRTGSPAINVTTSPTSILSPQRASSAAPAVSGFDDDAWTNRPSSTQPPAPSPPAQPTIRAPSAPPQTTTVAAPAPQPDAPATAQSPPAAPVAPAAPPPPAQAQTQAGGGLAKTTESDIFDQLARMTALRTQSPAVANPAPAPASAPVSAVSPPPVSFQNGLGMGASPVPLGQLQAQATGFPGTLGPRGPLAPVPANQGLLQPLVPTTTGFNSFVPTRPASNPPQFNTPSPQPSFLSTQPTGFTGPQFQQTGFVAPQPTGFQGPFNAQATGFPTSGPMVSQTTSYPGALGSGPFAGGRPFSALQPNVTGFNSGFGQVSSPPPVPPVPPLPSNQTKDTTPANVFAAMKSGTFGDETAPQPSNRYDALRPQPTGWGTTPTYQNGYSGPFY